MRLIVEERQRLKGVYANVFSCKISYSSKRLEAVISQAMLFVFMIKWQFRRISSLRVFQMTLLVLKNKLF